MRSSHPVILRNYDSLAGIRHEHFLRFYKIYYFKDAVFPIFEYVGFAIEDILRVLICLTKGETASMFSQVCWDLLLAIAFP